MTSLCLPTLLGWQVFYDTKSLQLPNPNVVTFIEINTCSMCFPTEVQMYVCNKETYGYLPVPLRTHNTLQDEADSFLHSLLEVNGK